MAISLLSNRLQTRIIGFFFHPANDNPTNLKIPRIKQMPHSIRVLLPSYLKKNRVKIGNVTLQHENETTMEENERRFLPPLETLFTKQTILPRHESLDPSFTRPAINNQPYEFYSKEAGS